MNVIVYYLSLRHSERKPDRELEREGRRLGSEARTRKWRSRKRTVGRESREERTEGWMTGKELERGNGKSEDRFEKT